MRFLTRLTTIAMGLAGAAADAQAHAFAQRYDLPLPLSYWLAGAGAAVALSFVASALALTASASAPAVGDANPSRIARWPHWLRSAIRIVAVGLFVVHIAAGLVGPQDEPQDNVLPVTVWVLWWVGLTVIVACIGDIWRAINPLRVIAEWAAVGAGRLGLAPRQAPFELPGRLASWPAVALFLCFAWAELVWTSNGVPAILARAILLYCALTFAAMAAFGIDTWLSRGDPFSRFFALIGRFAPVDATAGRWRPYADGAVTKPASDASQAAFILVVLATVSFDGLKETPFWAELAGNMMDLLYRAGLLALIGNVTAESIVKTAGLIATPLAMLAVYLVACAATAALVKDPSGHPQSMPVRTIALAFASTLVPIAIGYHVAHYFSYLLIQGQWIIPGVSDPFGLGWNLFGTRGFEPDIAVVDAATVWWTAVVAIVAGHVAAVVLAHLVALRLFASRRQALISQYPILALMIGYTMLSLWILAQPIVAH